MHMVIIFQLKIITMPCSTCCHVMALCHEDKQIFYFQCNHGTCVQVGMKCKYCNVIEFPKKGCIKNIKYIMLKLSSSHITSTTSNSDQNMIEYNSTISSNSIKLNQQQSYHVQHVLIYLQSAINITNLIILIVHQISCIFSQYVQYFSWWCA